MPPPDPLQAQPCQVRPVEDASNPDFRHAPLPSNGRSIRLLDIQSSQETAPRTDLRCTLRHADLNDRPNYLALSYVWGDPKDTVGILVNSTKYDVTVNCHTALRRIQETKDSSIWVDAVCINQKDDDEKSRQIPLMRDIYNIANEVVVWLGSNKADQGGKGEEERLGFGLMAQISSASFTGNNLRSFAEVTIPGEDPILCWQSMVEICKNPWFDRLWCHQEILLSSQATVMGQHYSISWAELACAVLTVYQNIDPSSFLLIHDSSLSQWMATVDRLLKSNAVVRCLHNYVRMLYDNRSLAEDGKKKHFSLVTVLIATRTLKCYDPRDRISAILGLVENDLGIRPNYNETPEELFTKVTWAILRKTRALEALCLAGTGASPTTFRSQLPSWVVDWNPHYEQAIPLDYHAYQAAPLSASDEVKFSKTLSILEVFGTPIDTVMVRLTDDTKGEDCWRKASMTLWRDRFDMYPTRCDPSDAYIRTVTADRTWNYLGRQEGDRLSKNLVSQYKIMAENNAKLTQDILSGRRDDRELPPEMERLYACFTKRISEVTRLRAFFISSTGYMGIGPRTVEEHDMICVLPGCNVPLLIRKVDNRHLLVGACFVWGLMDGEALEACKGVAHQGFRLW